MPVSKGSELLLIPDTDTLAHCVHEYFSVWTFTCQFLMGQHCFIRTCVSVPLLHCVLVAVYSPWQWQLMHWTSIIGIHKQKLIPMPCNVEGFVFVAQEIDKASLDWSYNKQECRKEQTEILTNYKRSSWPGTEALMMQHSLVDLSTKIQIEHAI